MYLILTYFDRQLGPRYFLTSHPSLADDIQSLVLNLMDIIQEHGFFEYGVEDQDHYLANYIFQIPSEWARGKVERIMITIVLDPMQKPKAFKKVLEKFVDDVKKSKDIYKGFYVKDRGNDIDVVSNHKLIENFFNELIENCERVLKQTIFGEIFLFGAVGVGKSKMIEKLKLDNLDFEIQPTIGFYLTHIIYQNLNLIDYDLDPNGKTRYAKLRSLQPPIGLVYMTTTHRLTHNSMETLAEFQDIIKIFYGSTNDEICLKRYPLLILLNRSNDSNDINLVEYQKLLKIEQYPLLWHLGYIDFDYLDTIWENFQWLAQQFLRFKMDSC